MGRRIEGDRGREWRQRERGEREGERMGKEKEGKSGGRERRRKRRERESGKEGRGKREGGERERERQTDRQTELEGGRQYNKLQERGVEMEGREGMRGCECHSEEKGEEAGCDDKFFFYSLYFLSKSNLFPFSDHICLLSN